MGADKDDSEGFFSKGNRHRAYWAAVVGVLGFAGGKSYETFNGPTKVVLDTSAHRKNPIPVSVIDENKSPPTTNSNELVKELRGLQDTLKKMQITASRREDNSKQAAHQVPPPSSSTPTPDELEGRTKLERALENIKRLQQQLDDQAKQPRPATSPTVPLTPIELLKTTSFAFPDSVNSYYQVGPIKGFSDPSCPPSKIVAGESLAFWFKISDVSIFSRVTPLYVRIIEERKPNDYWQSLSQWYEMRPGQNKVEISTPLAPGKYELTYGVYLRSELNKETPNFRSKECKFIVAKHI